MARGVVGGMTVDASEALDALGKIEAALTKPGLKKLGKTAERQMDQSVSQAFSSQSEPETGKRWAPRRYHHRHPMLDKTGRLRRSIKSESKVWVGKFSSALYLHFMLPDDKESLIKGLAVFYGRSRGRTGRGTRRGVSRSGVVPGRKYLGLNKSGRQTLITAAKKNVRI